MSNPSQRLLNLISLLKQCSSKKREITSAEAFAEIFSFDPKDFPSFYDALTKFTRLPVTIRNAMKLASHDPDLYLKWMPECERAVFAVGHGSKVRAFAEAINSKIEYGLEIASDVLERYSPEAEIDLDELETIRTDVIDLINKIKKSSVHDELRVYLMGHLLSLDEAIRFYQILGPSAIRQSLQAVFGSACTDSELAKASDAIEEGQRFWDVVGRTAQLMQIGWVGLQIVDKVIPGFLSGNAP
ncbi:hypothetical protein H5P28_18195 [Ruficoccus amylovorans]|uniref:Uncharacterized protein n=1 Tax=Ruficoccus amylovorans TaxID=1804625 RepID=A0A842HI50_9BACT|nr:hypothetical protein [Ruficoccus amylovorans]MBC2596203.1 hypothetical protein [Ruficoccus amylovorans]